MAKKPKTNALLVQVNTRLFHTDIEEIKRRAEEKAIPWQVELRGLLRRALQEEKIQILK